MNSPVAGVPQQHSDLLKSLADFSKEHRAARWGGTFSGFLEGVFPTDPRGIARSSHQYMWDMMRAEGYDDASDGRGLDAARARKVLEYVRRVWRRPVRLRTVDERSKTVELVA